MSDAENQHYEMDEIEKLEAKVEIYERALEKIAKDYETFSLNQAIEIAAGALQEAKK